MRPVHSPWPIKVLSSVFNSFLIRRRIRKVPRFRIEQFPEDTLGRAVGRVRPLDRKVLEAPLSGRLCVYYAIEVDVVGRDMTVDQVRADNLGVSFLLDDGGHRAVIDPTAARVMCMFDHKSEVKVRGTATERQRAVYDPRGATWFETTRTRYREAIIEVDEDIVVVGAGTREPDPDAQGTYRDARQTRLRLTGSERHQLEITDDPAVRT